ncbi:MAG TPA: acetyl-CoA synthetase [Clostridiales bacterium]|nr:acetyl-CoA synthetase [Clostridiales bacterium]
MNLLDKYVSKLEYDSYEDFRQNFSINVSDEFNFAYDVVDEYALKCPDKRAVVWCNDEGEEHIFNFRKLKELSDKAAAFFQSIGIKKGDKVMLILKRRYEFWYIIIALHKIGAIGVPVTHLLRKKDIVYRNVAGEIKTIVCLNESEIVHEVELAMPESPSIKNLVMVNGEKEGWLSFDQEISRQRKDFVRPVGEQYASGKDTMLLYFTSGTSGMPKMVLHNYTYPLAHIVTAKYWHCCVDDGLHFTISDTGWMKAMWGKLYGQWIAGSAVLVYDMDKFIAPKVLKIMEKYKITTFCAPPTMYRFFIKEDLSAFDLSAIKHCTIAGEPLNPEVYYQWLKATGLKCFEGFGQTELTLAIANFPWMEPKPGSMGRANAIYDVDLVDENGESCIPGQEGQIVLKTEHKNLGIFDGYYKDDELTKSVWSDHVYHTGDMAYRDEDGYFWFVGRADDVIKSSGYRIGPFEVESALIQHKAVVECAITAAPDEIRGQVVKATVVLAKGYTPSDALKKELQDHVKEITAPYKYPRIIEFVEELPKTISGKIQRNIIKKKSYDEK